MDLEYESDGEYISPLLSESTTSLDELCPHFISSRNHYITRSVQVRVELCDVSQRTVASGNLQQKWYVIQILPLLHVHVYTRNIFLILIIRSTSGHWFW